MRTFAELCSIQWALLQHPDPRPRPVWAGPWWVELLQLDRQIDVVLRESLHKERTPA